MKKILFPLMIVSVLFGGHNISAQEFPLIPESVRINMLNPREGKVRMVLDTDTHNEIDDQFAVIYALLSKEKLIVEALYAAPYSNSRSNGPEDGMEKSYEEILRLLDHLKIDHEGFVFKGSRNYLTNLENPVQSPAALDLIKKARSATPEEPLYVVAVGAITNVASAILIDPSILDKIVIVWLGGNSVNWPHTREFNLSQDLKASQLIFNCGVSLVQLPCTPVVTHFSTSVPEMETYLKGQGTIGDYLLDIFKNYHKDHYAWSKVLWDMTAVAWLVNADWAPSNLIHSPILTDQHTYSFDDSRHLIRAAYFIHRDPIFRDFFQKIEQQKK